MHCGIQYDGFPFQTLMASIFFFKTQLAEMSKQKQVQTSLNTFFGGKRDRESNMTPTMPAPAQGNTEVSRFVEGKVQMVPL